MAPEMGVVRRQAVALQPLLQDVVGLSDALARDKGLRLILHPTAAVVDSDPVLLEQIPVMEELLSAAGFTVWPMVEWEADDALGAAAAVATADERVETVMIITPDKDLGQCVRGKRVVQYDRRKQEIIDEDDLNKTSVDERVKDDE